MKSGTISRAARAALLASCATAALLAAPAQSEDYVIDSTVTETNGGYAATHLTSQSRFADSHDIDSSGVFAAVDGRYSAGAWRLGFGVNGGWMAYDSSRFINDNLAEDEDGATRGNSWAEADYNSWFVSPQLSVGYELVGLAEGWTLTPTARGRYGYEAIGGYSESGAWTDTSNAKVGSRNIGFVEGVLELVAERPFMAGGDTGLLTLRGGLVSRRSTGDDAVPVTLIGIEQDVAFGDTDLTAGFAGLGAKFDIAGGGELALDGQGWFGSGISGFSGMVRYTIRR